MNTAPRDGTWILAVNAKINGKRKYIVRYSELHSTKFPWVTDAAPMSFVDGLTHWMPLPEAPTMIKTININGFEVPEPCREPLSNGIVLFIMVMG